MAITFEWGVNVENVEKFYDTEYDEWGRLDKHKIEFDITKRYLDEYLSGTNLEIFDIGGGLGRYALYLAQQGHRVSLLDLSKHNIDVARAETVKLGVALEAYIHGNALDLHHYAEEKYDVVLLMGPLYHLVSDADRKKALAGALRLLKTNGILVASFISNYSPILDNLKYLSSPESIDALFAYLTCGVRTAEGFTTAYFWAPEEVRTFMGGFKLRELVFAGVENILGLKEQDINQLDEEEYQKWLEICYRLSQDPNLYGTTEHFLYIGRKEA